MRKLAIILGLAVLGVAFFAGWQIGACELANVELQDEMQDIASQAGTRVGLAQMVTDDDLRNAVVGRARQHDIELEGSQVAIEHMGSGETSTVYMKVDYRAPINLPGFSFSLHFTPETSRKLLGWRPHG